MMIPEPEEIQNIKCPVKCSHCKGKMLLIVSFYTGKVFYELSTLRLDKHLVFTCEKVRWWNSWLHDTREFSEDCQKEYPVTKNRIST